MGEIRHTRGLRNVGFGSLYALAFLLGLSSSLSYSQDSKTKVDSSPRLRDQLRLPLYLDQKFGLMNNRELSERLGLEKTIQNTEQLARGFWRLLPELDKQFALAVQGLPSDELENWCVKKLLSQEVSTDEWPSMWWSLKFEFSSVQSQVNDLSENKPLLMMARQYGFNSLSQGDWLSKVQDKLNMGHSALGLRYLGNNAEDDLYLQFTESLEAPTATYNFWQWTQTQIELRYTKIDLWVTPIASQQEKAFLKLLSTSQASALFQGPVEENLRRVLSFLSPISEMNVNITDTFFKRATLFQFPDQVSNNPHSSTPDVEFEKIHFPEPDTLSTFRDFKSWESRTFRQGPAPASLHP